MRNKVKKKVSPKIIQQEDKQKEMKNGYPWP